MVNIYRPEVVNTVGLSTDVATYHQGKKTLANLTVGMGEKWIGDLTKRKLKEIFTLAGGE